MVGVKFVVGLGNPGKSYEGTRHNIGKEIVATLSDSWRNKGEGSIAGASIGDSVLKLYLPGSFMNLSGPPVREIMSGMGLRAEELLVVHDELDLEVGKLRFKFGGGTAGHNGLKSIEHSLGNSNFYRLRVGVGRPLMGEDVAKWVLGRPNPEERKVLLKVRELAKDAIKELVIGGFEKACNVYNKV